MVSFLLSTSVIFGATVLDASFFLESVLGVLVDFGFTVVDPSVVVGDAVLTSTVEVDADAVVVSVDDRTVVLVRVVVEGAFVEVEDGFAVEVFSVVFGATVVDAVLVLAVLDGFSMVFVGTSLAFVGVVLGVEEVEVVVDFIVEDVVAGAAVVVSAFDVVTTGVDGAAVVGSSVVVVLCFLATSSFLGSFFAGFSLFQI